MRYDAYAVICKFSISESVFAIQLGKSSETSISNEQWRTIGQWKEFEVIDKIVWKFISYMSFLFFIDSDTSKTETETQACINN